MGLRLCDNGQGQCCMYDSVTDTAFGPVFQDEEEAREFLEFCQNEAPNGDPDSPLLFKRKGRPLPAEYAADPRGWSQPFLEETYRKFRQANTAGG